MKKFLLIILPLLVIAIIAYWWFFMRVAAPVVPTPTETGAFDPFNRASPAIPAPSQATPKTTASGNISTEPLVVSGNALPQLRHLSVTPVSGFMASTTASSTIVRFIDRGVGHVYQATDIDTVISKISNTTIPKVYAGYWDKNLKSAILRYLKDDDSIVNFYADLRPISKASSTTNSESLLFEIKGKFLSSSIKEIAVSPRRDRMFTFNIEEGRGIGYISGFDESKKTRVLDIPLTQVTVDWPEENTITIQTNPSGAASGYFYTLDLTTTAFKRILGNIMGLNSKMSADGKRVLFSSTSGRGFLTSLYNIKENSTQELIFKTSADKCVWSKLTPEDAYCAVPTEFPSGNYPDDWYRGNISFTDQIWHVDTTTGEVRLVANLIALSRDLIDAVELTLDPKEKYLYFINKRDLTLWSLDLTK